MYKNERHHIQQESAYATGHHDLFAIQIANTAQQSVAGSISNSNPTER